MINRRVEAVGGLRSRVFFFFFTQGIPDPLTEGAAMPYMAASYSEKQERGGERKKEIMEKEKGGLTGGGRGIMGGNDSLH